MTVCMWKYCTRTSPSYASLHDLPSLEGNAGLHLWLEVLFSILIYSNILYGDMQSTNKDDDAMKTLSSVEL